VGAKQKPKTRNKVGRKSETHQENQQKTLRGLVLSTKKKQSDGGTCRLEGADRAQDWPALGGWGKLYKGIVKRGQSKAKKLGLNAFTAIPSKNPMGQRPKKNLNNRLKRIEQRNANLSSQKTNHYAAQKSGTEGNGLG